MDQTQERRRCMPAATAEFKLSGLGTSGILNPRRATSKPRTNGKAAYASWQMHTVTAAELRTMVFPITSYIIPDFVPEGLTILAGRPKIGKSWLALDIAGGVAGAHEVFGVIPVVGDVLYCALEDTNRRLRNRLIKLGIGWPERLTLATRWRRFDAGGVADISDWCESVSEPRLVILDTLAGVRPERQSKDTNYDGDYRALLDLHRLVNDRAMGALVLHHTRKAEVEDQLDTISGTLGLVGCGDTGMILARTSQGTTLYTRGRDIEEQAHAVLFNKETCRWKLLGDAAEVQRSETRSTILGVLDTATGPLSPEQVAMATGLKGNTVHQRLHRMLADGEVIKLGRGQYATPARAAALSTIRSIST
jgi:hypothetical protein